MIDWSIFVAGCIGAAAPEIVRIYKTRLGSFRVPSSYYAISAVFFVLGGFVAIALPATTLWGAFYAGLSLPTIVTAALGKPQKPIVTPGLHAAIGPRFTLRGYIWLLFEYPTM